MARRLSDDQQFREAIAYLHGRIERELEAFADSVSFPKVVVTRRLGALLLGFRQGDENRLSHLPSSGNHVETRQGSSVPPKVEGTVESHGGSSLKQLEAAQSPSKAGENKVSAIKEYWAKMTPEERKKVMRERMKKWAPEAKAKWKKGT